MPAVDRMLISVQCGLSTNARSTRRCASRSAAHTTRTHIQHAQTHAACAYKLTLTHTHTQHAHTRTHSYTHIHTACTHTYSIHIRTQHAHTRKNDTNIHPRGCRTLPHKARQSRRSTPGTPRGKAQRAGSRATWTPAIQHITSSTASVLHIASLESVHK